MNDVADVPSLVVRRRISATAAQLFDAWLDPEALAVWMRPGSARRTTARVDARVGGDFEIVMHNESGPVPHTGRYVEIDRPRRLVFTWNSPHAGQQDSLVTVEFRAAGGATEIVLTHERLPSAKAVAAHNGGWTDALRLLADRFEARLAS